MAIQYKAIVVPLSTAKTAEEKRIQDMGLEMSFAQTPSESKPIDHRPRAEKRREAKATKKRTPYLAGQTTETLKPWISEGLSRRTWYRRRKEEKAK